MRQPQTVWREHDPRVERGDRGVKARNNNVRVTLVHVPKVDVRKGPAEDGTQPGAIRDQFGSH